MYQCFQPSSSSSATDDVYYNSFLRPTLNGSFPQVCPQVNTVNTVGQVGQAFGFKTEDLPGTSSIVEQDEQ